MNTTLIRAEEARTLTTLNEKYIAKNTIIEQINEAVEDAVYETGIANWCMTTENQKWLEDHGYIVEKDPYHKCYKISWK